jgi:hypothetical protein
LIRADGRQPRCTGLLGTAALAAALIGAALPGAARAEIGYDT